MTSLLLLVALAQSHPLPTCTTDTPSPVWCLDATPRDVAARFLDRRVWGLVCAVTDSPSAFRLSWYEQRAGETVWQLRRCLVRACATAFDALAEIQRECVETGPASTH